MARETGDRQADQTLSGAAVTATSWSPCVDLGFADWVKHGTRLGVIGRACGWWIGDWLRYGNTRYGEKYSRATQITGYDAKSLRNMVYVASRFDVSRRRRGLSWSHHAAVAALPVDEQERWLDVSERERLSVRCLRLELSHARRRLRDEDGVPDDGRVAASRARRDSVVHASHGDGMAPYELRLARDEQHAGAHHDGEICCPECGCRFAPQSRPGRLTRVV